MNPSTSVDEYIKDAPEDTHQKLNDLRAFIKKVVPAAEEKMSYGMPYYEYHGRLVYFAAAKHHIGLYIPPPIIKNHAKELKVYVTSKSAVQFPKDEELPFPLIEKLIRARMKHNEEQEKKKK